MHVLDNKKYVAPQKMMASRTLVFVLVRREVKFKQNMPLTLVFGMAEDCCTTCRKLSILLNPPVWNPETIKSK